MTSREDSGKERTPARQSMPKWVKVSLIVISVLILAFIVLQILGIGPQHGPGRHMQHRGHQRVALLANA